MDVEKVWQEFWLPIVSKDGELDMEQVKRELHDWYNAMHEVSIVYSELTGGILSKPNYMAQEVISLANEHFQQFEDERVQELEQEIQRLSVSSEGTRANTGERT